MTVRLEFRVTSGGRARIERAAELEGAPVTVFARAAAEERAERILREHEVTMAVTAAFFDELLEALDAPAQPSAELARAAERLCESVTRG